jgi:hypothetical protein
MAKQRLDYSQSDLDKVVQIVEREHSLSIVQKTQARHVLTSGQGPYRYYIILPVVAFTQDPCTKSWGPPDAQTVPREVLFEAHLRHH